ncbi:hypothetical protein C1646_766819 [Rhizophagus diaphanus]|nr:hypothetical protein C1646_766819 [Rhizophagus diaphanus] [Rhizophagus sp. MUCL 43196]
MASLKESTRLVLIPSVIRCGAFDNTILDSPEAVMCCFCLEVVFPMQGCLIRPCEHVFHAGCFIEDFRVNNTTQARTSNHNGIPDTFESETDQPIEDIEYTPPNNATTVTFNNASPTVDITAIQRHASPAPVERSEGASVDTPDTSDDLSIAQIPGAGIQIDESTSSPPQSTGRTNDNRRNACTARRNQLVQLLIKDMMNSEQGENFIDLQDRMEVRHNDILQRIRDLYYEFEHAEVDANNAFHHAVLVIFRFGEAIDHRYITLLSVNGNNHNASVALNREI